MVAFAAYSGTISRRCSRSASSPAALTPRCRRIPLKPEYGPTLGRLLAPRWHAASRLVQALVIVAGVGLLALVIGAGC